jgi:PAS domain S-box-containing protein
MKPEGKDEKTAALSSAGKYFISISGKIWLSLSIMIIGYAAWMITGFFRGQETLSHLTLVREQIFPAAIQSKMASTDFNEQIRMYKEAVVFGKTELLEEAKARSYGAQNALKQLVGLVRYDEGKIIEVREILRQLRDFTVEANLLYKKMALETEDISSTVTGKAAQLNRDSEAVKQGLIDLTDSFSNALKEEFVLVSKETRYQQYLDILIFFIAVMVSLSVIKLIISRWITRPLIKAAALARTMAEGNLSLKLDIHQNDEIGELAHAMNVMAGKVEESHMLLEQENMKLEKEIAERKKTELELLQVSQAVNSASDAIGMYSKDGIHFYQNEAYTDLFGYKIEELNSEGGPSVLLADQSLLDEIFQIVMKGNTWTREIETISRSGERIPIFCRVHPIKDNSGNIGGIMGIFTDIRERKKAEAELEAAHKQLVETARLVGRADVTAGILHNVGNVITSVNVTANSLKEEIRQSKIPNFVKAAGMFKEHEHDLADFLIKDKKGRKLPVYLTALSKHLQEEWKDCSLRLNELCNHVKIITELIAVQQAPDSSAGLTEVVSAAELLENAFRINAPSMTAHGIEIVPKFEKTPPCRLDHNKFMQIIINLLSNARNALKVSNNAPKTITVGLKKKGDNRFLIEVVDNGIGIFKENINKVFELGFTTKKKGQGFGLHIAAIHAMEMGGKLTAYSAGPGKGASFILELPLRQKDKRVDEDKNGKNQDKEK